MYQWIITLNLVERFQDVLSLPRISFATTNRNPSSVWPDSWLATFCPVHRRLISFPFYRVLHLFLPTFLSLPPSFQPPSEEAQRGKSVSMPRLIECICQFYEFTRRAYRNGYRSSRESKTNDSKSRVALNRENIPFRRSPTWNTIARRRNVDSIVAIPSTSSSLLLPLFSVLVFLFFTRAAPLDCFPCPFQPSIVPSYHLRHCARAPFLPRFLSTFFLLLFPICPFFFLIISR